MRKAILVGVVAGVGLFVAGLAWGAANEKDVAELVGGVQSGKRVDANLGIYPLDHWQLVRFQVGSGATVVSYIIDLRAQICLATGQNERSPVPCKNLKKGYPLIAPLITWGD